MGTPPSSESGPKDDTPVSLENGERVDCLGPQRWARNCTFEPRRRTKMFLQYERDRSAKSCHRRIGGRPHTRGFSNQRGRLYFGLNHGTKTRPLAGELAYQDDFLGGKTGDDHAHTATDCVRHFVEGGDCEIIAAVG